MHYLVANPGAGGGRDAAFWQRLLQEARVESRPWPAADAADRLPSLTPDDCLLVAGGDGTLRHQVPRCLASGCALGVLPSGTGNDFARGLGIPLDPAQACTSIASGEVVDVDVGRFNDEVFLNVVHVGMGSAVAPELTEETKRWWGQLSYLHLALKRVHRQRGFRATIRCGGSTVHGRWLEVAVANGSSFGGGHRVFEASPFDGRLDVVAVRPRPLYQLLGVWLWAWLHRSMPGHEAIVVRRGARCEVTSPGRRRVTADGDEVGELPGRFSVTTGALRVIVPRRADGVGDGQ